MPTTIETSTRVSAWGLADRTQGARRFLRHLFNHVEGLIEVRCIQSTLPPGHRDHVRREFFRDWNDPALIGYAFAHAGTRNVYVGVAVRRERRGNKAACLQIGALFTDLDFKLFPSEPVAFERLDAFPIPPTMVIHSGGGLQPYWRLVPAVSAQAPDAIEGRLRGLCRAVGGDPAAVDVNRVLRLPGTFNLKPERVAAYGGPVPVRLLRCCDAE